MLAGEQEFPLAPLAVPPPVSENTFQASPAALHTVPSVGLFVDRARLARPDFILTEANADAIAEICRRLEGVPLALEMAAAWVRTLSPAHIATRVSQRVHELHSRRRDLPNRHRSLRAVVEWSWELLTPELRNFLAAMSVVRGGWTSNAAESIYGSDALEFVAQLQEHSLLLRTEPTNECGDEERYRFLEPVREWGLEKLGENPSMRHTAYTRHADFFLQLAESFCRSQQTATSATLFALDVENCVAALNWFVQAGTRRMLDGVRMATYLADYWKWRGLYALSYQMLSEAITGYRDAISPSGKLEIASPPDSQLVLAEGLHAASDVARYTGHLEEARRSILEAQAIYTALNKLLEVARCEGEQGTLAMERGELSVATKHFQSALEISRQTNNTHILSVALLCMGGVAHEQGNWETARSCYSEALTLFQERGDLFRCVCILLNQSTLALQENLPDEAQNHVEESLDLAIRMENPRLAANVIATGAAVAARKGLASRAVCLFGAADEIIAQTKAPLLPTEARDRDLATGGNDWLNALTPAQIAQAQAQGRAMTLPQAAAFVHER